MPNQSEGQSGLLKKSIFEKAQLALNGSLPVLHEQQALLQALPLHVGCVDASGCYQYWNPHSEKMFGYAAHEVIGTLGPQIIFSAKEFASKVIRTVEDGECFNGEVLLIPVT